MGHNIMDTQYICSYQRIKIIVLQKEIVKTKTLKLKENEKSPRLLKFFEFVKVSVAHRF